MIFLFRLCLQGRRRRYLLSGLRHGSDPRDEAIPAARQGLNETRFRGGIIQNLANFADRSSQTLIEVDECVSGPKFLADLFSCDKFTWTLQKHGQKLKRLCLQPYSLTIFSQLAGMKIRFERAELKPT